MDPMIFLWIFLVVAGLALLVKGADFFVDGAAGVAKKCGISPLVIGLTVVAFGTSAPELAVSVASAIRGFTDLSVGNVLGSNIANILLILGVSALVRPLPVHKNSIRLDIPVLLVCSVLIILLGLWGDALQWWDGLIFLAIFVLYMFFLFRDALREKNPKDKPSSPEEEKKPKKMGIDILFTVLGLVMVAGGGYALVEGAKKIAEAMGVTERIIGLTVVALGTSLPELVTSVVAARKGETDIAVGNILGSNIFNILLVAGVASLICPLAFSFETNLVDALVALAAALLLAVCALAGKHKLKRGAGAAMLVSFLAYYAILFVM